MKFLNKILYILFIIMLSVIFISCGKSDVVIEKEVIYNINSNTDLHIKTENVESIEKITYDNKELDNKYYGYNINTIYIKKSYFNELTYGQYKFTITIESDNYEVLVYLCDNRVPELKPLEKYEYNNSSISIPIKLYNGTIELKYQDEVITEYSIKDGNLIIKASFIELCKEADIYIDYTISYLSNESYDKFSKVEGQIYIHKILFGDIEW